MGTRRQQRRQPTAERIGVNRAFPRRSVSWGAQVAILPALIQRRWPLFFDVLMQRLPHMVRTAMESFHNLLARPNFAPFAFSFPRPRRRPTASSLTSTSSPLPPPWPPHPRSSRSSPTPPTAPSPSKSTSRRMGRNSLHGHLIAEFSECLIHHILQVTLCPTSFSKDMVGLCLYWASCQAGSRCAVCASGGWGGTGSSCNQIDETLEITPRCVLELPALPLGDKHQNKRQEGLQGVRNILWTLHWKGLFAHCLSEILASAEFGLELIMNRHHIETPKF